MTRRFTAKGLETRTRIVRAGREALVADGPEALALRSVAARAGMSLGNLQFYFADLDALLAAILAEELRAGAAAVEAARAGATDPIEATLDVLLGQHDDIVTVKVFFSLWAFAVGRPKMARILREFYAELVAQLGREMSVVRADLSDEERETRAWLFVALLEGSSVLRALRKRGDETHSAALREKLRELLLG